MAIMPRSFFLVRLPAAANFATAAGRRGLGGLSAGVGVHFGVHNEDVDVLAHGQHVIESAVTDVVSPAVAAEDPLALLDQQVADVIDLLARSRRSSQPQFMQSSNHLDNSGAALRQPSASSLLSSHAVQTALTSSPQPVSKLPASIVRKPLAAVLVVARFMPKPNSALSSNREFAHAGP